jgi:hypothetical protein
MYESKTSDQPSETYTGLTVRPFKARYYEHTSNSNNKSESIKITLRGHIWNLKKQGENLYPKLENYRPGEDF